MKCSFCDRTIEDHPAIRCLDATVAEVVFGWTNIDDEDYDWGMPPNADVINLDSEIQHSSFHRVQRFSTNIFSAWSIVEFFRNNVPAYSAVRIETTGVGYQVAFYSHHVPLNRPNAYAHGETIQLAIVRAALGVHDDV